MDSSKKQKEPITEKDPMQQINLDDYAGDEEDNRIAIDNANRYMDDIERAKEQGTLKPDQEQPE
ncbi:hypothetical protein SAMN05444008_12633 [Cnuella takakiae]|uniref:Uncharacterized protein n=1 Tax=Cnuella takakiae TaxID=1302690 RepID=A0A1M5IZP1_9BACT|nr:hypothetical protein [Cnuella takakiae]OLY91416.1 hypothetical protein BUE76_05500 [Cnuella takakiae]SHG33223.1 hypothetical protein SAMN05444008_12633 [Cnuella takakiae]